MPKPVENFIKLWVPMIALALSLGMSFGYTKSEISNIKNNVRALRVETIPRNEFNEIIKRLDAGVIRLEAQIDKLEERGESK